MLETLPARSQPVQMILRSGKIRRGDVIIEQVPDAENPYREVVITEQPVVGEIFYQGHWHEVRYFTGVDSRTQRTVKHTGTEHRPWQIVRQG